MKSVRFFGLFITLVLAVSSIATPAVATPAAEPANPAASFKIEADLLDALTAEGSADFIVQFVEQADLSPAFSMGWDERGWFVYDTLRAVAARSQAMAQALLDTAGLSHQTFLAGNELYVWDGTLSAAQTLAALNEVEYIRAPYTFYVDPIVEQEPLTEPNALAWGIVDAKADQFWAAFGVKGDGIKVANIDTGVQWDHPALVNQFACPGDPGNAACWRDPSNICPGGTACDNNGHGTHVMGTQAGSDDPGLTWQAGMAPNSTWIACKGCESSSCSEFALNTCADWIVAPDGDPANRPHVVNNSWGGGSACDGWYWPKVNAWRAAGVFPAFSAGNAGSSCNSLGQPSNYQDSFATAAHASNRNIASFSSRGPAPTTAYCHPYEPYTKPNISAPGVSICSSVPGNGWSCGYSGTSMSSPHTAGAVALLWSCNPALVGQLDLTFEALQDYADPPTDGGNCGAPPTGNGNYTYGYGLLNVLEAGMAWCGDVDFGYLDGYVYDADTLAPIEGATVNAVKVPGALIADPDELTDPTGYYTMTRVVGTYDVTAWKYGYAPQTVTGVEIITDTVTHQDFYLEFQGAWLPGPSLPDCFNLTRFDAEFFPGDGMVYILGGRYDTLTYGAVYRFDPVAGTCTATGANMPVPISNYTTNLVNDGDKDLLCAFGGRDSAGNQTLAVQCYDPVANTASVVTNLPSAYTGYMPGAQAVVDNHVYVFGGFNPNTTPYELIRTDRYDPVTQTFTQVGNLSLGRGYIMAAVVDGKIYAFGGTIFDGAGLNAQVRTEVMADPGGAGTWNNAAVAELPTASAEGRAFGFDSDAGFNIQGKVVLAGGGQWPGETNEVLTYDVATDTYDTTFPNLNQARRNHAGAFVPLCTDTPDDGLPGMWVFGGRSGSDAPPYAGTEFFPLVCDQEVEPVASFEAEVGCDLDVQFTDTSTGPPTEWLWDFGDGNSSTEQHPLHVYSLAGVYTVTLWVENDLGSDSATETIAVFDPVVAEFSWTPSAIYPEDAVQFTDESTGGLAPWTYDWDFGDGSGSTDPNPLKVFVDPGDYTVSLTVTDANLCTDMSEQMLTVREPDEFFMIYLPVVLRNF